MWKSIEQYFSKCGPWTSSVTLSMQTIRPLADLLNPKLRVETARCVLTSPQGAQTCAEVWEVGLRNLDAHPGLLSSQGLRSHPLCVLASSTLQMSHVLRTVLCGRRPRCSEMPAEPAFPGRPTAVGLGKAVPKGPPRSEALWDDGGLGTAAEPTPWPASLTLPRLHLTTHPLEKPPTQVPIRLCF